MKLAFRAANPIGRLSHFRASSNASGSSSKLPFPILHETENWLAINKPVGINSVPNESLTEVDCVTHYIVAAYPEMVERFRDPTRCGAVHRLDRNTSGVLLIAKDHDTHEALRDQFARRQIEKCYWALVFGELTGEGKFTDRVVYDPHSRHVLDEANGNRKGIAANLFMSAETLYRPLEVYEMSGERVTFVEVHPLTGRTHQIRFHFGHHGYPLVGEKFYTKHPRSEDPFYFSHFPGQALHARSIRFFEPQLGTPLELTCNPLPNPHTLDRGFMAALNVLRQYRLEL